MLQAPIHIDNSTGVLVNTGHIDTAGGDVLVGGQKVTNIFQNADYLAMVERIKEYEIMVRVAVDPVDRLSFSQKLQDFSKRKKDFEEQVIQMAETFQQLTEGSSERLKQAQEYFEKGDFKGASALLDSREMEEEQDKLLKARERAEEKLRNSAHEFLVKAQATALDYDNPKRFEDCCDFFEKSLKSSRLYENLQAYGLFMASHNQLDKGLALLKECLPLIDDKLRLFNFNLTLGMLSLQKQDFAASEKYYRQALEMHETVDWEDDNLRDLKKADAMLSLGFLFNTINHDDDAKVLFDDSLAIREALAAKNPEDYGICTAPALSHRGLLFYEHKMFDAAQQDFETAIQLLTDYIDSRPADDVIHTDADEKTNRVGSMALLWHNLALVYMVTNPEKAEEFSLKALEALAPMVKKNPFTYEPTHAFILNGLGMFYINQEMFDKAQAPLEESVEIYERLAKVDATAFEGHLAMFLNNLGIYHAKTGDHVQAQPYLARAIELYRHKTADTPGAFNGMLALALQNLGESRYFSEDEAGGIEMITVAKQMFKDLLQTQPESISAAYVICSCTLGALLLSTDKKQNAAEHWQDAYNICTKNLPDNPTVYLPLTQLTTIMLAGRIEELEDNALQESYWWMIINQLSPLREHENLDDLLGLAASEFTDLLKANIKLHQTGSAERKLALKKQADLKKWLKQNELEI